MSDSDSVIIGDYFSLGNKIGTGSFGDIYDGENIETKERVGIKLEPTDVRHAQLPNESKIYQQVQGCPGFPRMYHYGKQGRYFVLVMELLGKSLDDYCSQHEREPFSNEQVMGLALQILDRLEVLHSKGLVYRDIKPANFLFGRDSSPSSSSETTSTTSSATTSSSSSSSSSSNSDSAVSTSTAVSPSTSSTSVSSVSSDSSSSSSSTSSSSSSASSSSSSPSSSSSEQQTATTSSLPTPTKYITLPSAPLYLIDFGLTRPVKDSSHHHHHHNSSGNDLSALGLERKHSSSPHHSPHNSTDKSSSSPVSSSSSSAAPASSSSSSPHTLSPSSAASSSSSSSSSSASASSTTTGSSYRFKEPKKSNSGGLVGTARYASIAAHEGRHLSQRDDLESVVYVLIFMLRGELPWQSVRGRERQDIYDQIGSMKREITMRDLCLGVPTSILAMMMYVKTMEYGQHPDYTYLKQLFSPQNSASTSLVTKDTLSLTLSREPSNSSHHSPVSTVSSISGSGLLSAAHSRTSSMESSGSSTISSSPMIIPYSQQQHTLPSHKSSKSTHTTPSSSPPAPPSQMLSRAGTPEYLLNKSNPHIPLRTHSPSPSPSPASSASSSGFDPLAMLGLSRHFTDGKTTTSNTSHSLLSSHHHHHGGSPSQKGGHGHTSSHSPPPTISRGKSSEPVKWEQKFKI